MQIRVLGCSGSIAAGSRTTAFLVDHDILIDAGTGVGDLTLDEMVAIDHIFVTHSHLDHVLAIGLLADSVTRRRAAAGRPPVLVHALPATVHALREHVFNGVIWPDFTRLPDSQHPVLRFAELAPGDVVTLGSRAVEVLPATHTVPAVGYAVSNLRHPEAGAWVFTGDTGPNPALWDSLRALPLAQLIIEVAFGDDEAALAARAGHHCPESLAAELLHCTPGAFPIWLTHLKPGEHEAIAAQLAARLPAHRARLLSAGQTLSLDDAD